MHSRGNSSFKTLHYFLISVILNDTKIRHTGFAIGIHPLTPERSFKNDATVWARKSYVTE